MHKLSMRIRTHMLCIAPPVPPPTIKFCVSRFVLTAWCLSLLSVQMPVSACLSFYTQNWFRTCWRDLKRTRWVNTRVLSCYTGLSVVNHTIHVPSWFMVVYYSGYRHLWYNLLSNTSVTANGVWNNQATWGSGTESWRKPSGEGVSRSTQIQKWTRCSCVHL